jgi:asparagine synthase (glutamine-hydrolysing)
MCGLFMSNISDVHAGLMGAAIAHRGADSNDIRSFKSIHLGLNRLAIVARDDPEAKQPLETDASLIAFNGEIYNTHKLPNDWSEIAAIEGVMRYYPGNFERFLDGYYAIVRVDKGRERVIVSRDPIGVMPLYYYKFKDMFFVSSETKGLPGTKHIKEVKPGETIEFDFQGRIKKRRIFEPISLHMETMDINHLEFLFHRAVARRVQHADGNVKVTVALSGGLDSAMVLASAARVHRHIDAITIALDHNDPHVERSRKLALHYGVEHQVIVLTPDLIRRHWPMITFYLEDPYPNVIKYAAMIRNYFVAMTTQATVILCGEGADELGGGYPSHRGLSGIDLQWKCFSTLRSMHAINLDRVNKGGMAHTKEYRVPFLDRGLVQYMMACEKPIPGKMHFKLLAKMIGLPDYAIAQSKFNIDDTRFRDLARDLLSNKQAPSTAA